MLILCSDGAYHKIDDRLILRLCGEVHDRVILEKTSSETLAKILGITDIFSIKNFSVGELYEIREGLLELEAKDSVKYIIDSEIEEKLQIRRPSGGRKYPGFIFGLTPEKKLNTKLRNLIVADKLNDEPSYHEESIITPRRGSSSDYPPRVLSKRDTKKF